MIGSRAPPHIGRAGGRRAVRKGRSGQEASDDAGDGQRRAGGAEAQVEREHAGDEKRTGEDAEESRGAAGGAGRGGIARAVGAGLAPGVERAEAGPAVVRGGQMRCLSFATATACARFSAPSLPKIEVTWNFAVRSLMRSAAAISLFD